jgi:hypothetical protein
MYPVGVTTFASRIFLGMGSKRNLLGHFIAADLISSHFITSNLIAIVVVNDIPIVIFCWSTSIGIRADRVINQTPHADHLVTDIAFDFVSIVLQTFLQAP